MLNINIMFFINTIFRNSISPADWLALSPGATIILNDNIYSTSTVKTATDSTPSSSTRLYLTLKVLLLCLLFIKICGAQIL